MKSYDQIVEDYNRRFAQFLDNTQEWRRESAEMLQLRDRGYISDNPATPQYNIHNEPELRAAQGHLTSEERKFLQVVSLAPPILRSCAGLIKQGRRTFDSVPLTRAIAMEADAMSDALKFATHVSGFDDVFADVLLTSMTTGVGASFQYLDFENRQYPWGVPKCEEVHHILFDNGKLGGLGKGNIYWCGYAQPVYLFDLQEHIEDTASKPLAEGANTFREKLLEYTQPENSQDIDFLTNYFWCEKETVLMVENRYRKNQDILMEIGHREPLAIELFLDFVKQQQLDIANAPYFMMGSEAWKKYQELDDNIEKLIGERLPEPEITKTKMNVYYRAEFGDGKLLSAGQSYTQETHPMTFMTCHYDRAQARYYGLLRDAAPIQTLLNEVMGNYAEYSRRSLTGGQQLMSNLGTDVQSVGKYIKNKEQVLVVGSDARVTGINTPDGAHVHDALSSKLVDFLFLSLGVGKESVGQLNTDTPAASLFQAAQRQMQVSISYLLSSVNRYLYYAGTTFRDMIVHLAQNHEQIVLPRLYATKQNEQEPIVLSKQSIGRNYSTILVDKEMDADLRFEQFSKLMQLLDGIDPAMKAQAMGVLIDLANIDEEVKLKLAEALQPPQQTPEQQQIAMMQQQLQLEQLQGNNRMINAQAAQLEQQAGREQSASALNERKSVVEIDKAIADINHKEAQTIKTEADAASVIANIGMQQYNMVNNMESRADA
ncbi:MAG: hypothetical protein ACKO96_05055 [Flammeovirgaceae bacterium]